MFSTDSISQMKPEKVRNSSKGVLNNFYSPFAHMIITNKSVMNMTTLNNLHVSQVHIHKHVVNHLPHVKSSTVSHHHTSVVSQNDIRIKTMQIVTALNLNFVINNNP